MTTAGKREQTLLEWAGAIQLPPVLPACRILHIAPVAAELAAGEVVERVPAEFVGLTPQGLIRSWDATGRVLLRPIDGGGELARRVHAVVAAECECPYLAPLLEEAVRAGAVAVVTKGAAGCEVRSAAGVEQYPAVRVAEPVDDTGAGDVFAAALFVELHRGAPVAGAVRFASAAAALSLRGIGPQGIASRTEIAGLAGQA